MPKNKKMSSKWWTLAAMGTSISMIFVDVTVLPVALPTIQKHLHLTELGLQWIVNAYILALTMFLLAGGRLGDRHGHRKIFLFGLLTFSTGSILCGLSHSEWWFITSRAVQGLGGAMMIPCASAILLHTFPKLERGRAFGLFVSIGSIFLALGPFIGGVFSQYASWRLIFWINPPIALIGTFLTLRFVSTWKLKKRPLDRGGFLAFSLGICAIVIALMQGQSWGWFSPLTISLFVGGLFLIVLLIRIDRSVEDPYIDFSLFKCKTFVGCCLTILITQSILMITVFWAIYFQNVLGFSPSQAGTLALLSNAPIIIVAPLGGHLLDRKGPKIPITIGFCLVAASLFWFLQNLDNPSIGRILSAIIPFGCGIPLILTPTFTTAVAEINPQRRGLASGTVSTFRQLGGTIGLAVIGTVFLSMQTSQFARDLAQNKETAAMDTAEFEGLLSQSPQAIERLNEFSPKGQDYIHTSYKDAYKKGFWAINFLGVLLALAGLVVTRTLIKKTTYPDL